MRLVCFFFNDTATTEIYTLSLHDALPISGAQFAMGAGRLVDEAQGLAEDEVVGVLAVELADEAGAGRRRGGAGREGTPLKSPYTQNPHSPFFFKKKKNILNSSALLSRLSP